MLGEWLADRPLALEGVYRLRSRPRPSRPPAHPRSPPPPALRAAAPSAPSAAPCAPSAGRTVRASASRSRSLRWRSAPRAEASAWRSAASAPGACRNAPRARTRAARSARIIACAAARSEGRAIHGPMSCDDRIISISILQAKSIIRPTSDATFLVDFANRCRTADSRVAPARSSPRRRPALGHMKRPRSSLFVNRHAPWPSCQITFNRSPRRPRKQNKWPPNGSCCKTS